MTSLNIGAVTPDRKAAPPRPSAKCPQCGAGSDQREKVGSFGSHDTRTLCTNCAYEFQEPGR